MAWGGEDRNAGCLIAALIAGGGLLAMAAIAVVAFALLFTRAAPAPSPAPVSTPVAVLDGAAGSDVSEPEPDLTLRVTRASYQIRGRTAAELRRQMDALGPRDASGRHDAYTNWYVRWSYPFERGDRGCGLGRVQVRVDVTITLPEWQAPQGSDDELARAWRRYLAALASHEDGHRLNGLGAGRSALDKLRKLAPQASCDAADERANEIGRQIVAEHQRRDERYDRETGHGAKQGARFP